MVKEGSIKQSSLVIIQTFFAGRLAPNQREAVVNRGKRYRAYLGYS